MGYHLFQIYAYHDNCSCMLSVAILFVTRFGKTNPFGTTSETHFIAPYTIHSCTYYQNTVIEQQEMAKSAFLTQLVHGCAKHWETCIGCASSVGPLGFLIGQH